MSESVSKVVQTMIEKTVSAEIEIREVDGFRKRLGRDIDSRRKSWESPCRSIRA